VKKTLLAGVVALVSLQGCSAIVPLQTAALRSTIAKSEAEQASCVSTAKALPSSQTIAPFLAENPDARVLSNTDRATADQSQSFLAYMNAIVPCVEIAAKGRDAESPERGNAVRDAGRRLFAIYQSIAVGTVTIGEGLTARVQARDDWYAADQAFAASAAAQREAAHIILAGSEAALAGGLAGYAAGQANKRTMLNPPARNVSCTSNRFGGLTQTNCFGY
jgi:hypothetical protein